MNSAYIYKRKLTKSYTLELRKRSDKETLRYVLGVKIKLSSWDDETMRIIDALPLTSNQVKNMNELIENALDAMDIVCERFKQTYGRYPIQKEIKNLMDRHLYPEVERRLTFWDAWTYVIENEKDRAKAGKVGESNYKRYTRVKGALEKYEKSLGKSIYYELIDIKFIKDFENYCEVQLEHSNNYIIKIISAFAQMMKIALAMGWTDNKIGNHPNFNDRKEESVDGIYNTVEELKNILKAQIPDALMVTRDYYIIGCLAGGQRQSDFSRISKDKFHQKEDGSWFIEILTQKTKAPVVIPCHPIVLQIMEYWKWELPAMKVNQVFNRELKEIAKRAKIKEHVEIKKGQHVTSGPKWKYMSSKVARRTFITILYEYGLKINPLAQITGRTSTEIQKYIDGLLLTRREAQELQATIFEAFKGVKFE